MEKEMVRKEKGVKSRMVSMEFLASVSHEIRNPLNIIIGLSHLLKCAETEEEKQRYTHELIDTSQALLNLVNNIMDFSRVDAGKLHYEFKSCELKESILHNIAGYKTVAEAKGLELLIEVSHELPSFLYTDPVKINQVLLNLVSNALKFTEKGTVKLLVDTKGSRKDSVIVNFEVRDTGRGIPPEKLETIFNAFDQGSDEINLQFGGTGLGLSICKEVVTALGGDLKVESRVGEGSSFSFELELSVSEKEVEERSEDNRSGSTSFGERPTVLAVDDSEMNTLLIKKTLEKENCRILMAHDGLSAVKILQEEKVDLVLLDIHMPKMNGVEAAGIIRNLPGLRDLPIIAVTGSADISSLKDLETSIFSEFILKPFHPDELAKKTIAALCSTEAEQA